MWRDEVAGDQDYTTLRNNLANALHVEHGGDDGSPCFLCRQSIGIVLHDLYDRGLRVSVATTVAV